MRLSAPFETREKRQWRERRMEIGRREQEARAMLRQVERDREASDRELHRMKPLPWGDADTLSFLSYPRPTHPAPPLPPSCRPRR